MSNKNNIEIKTEEVSEILSESPRWILRWGISLFFLLILSVITLSWFIKYPDILVAEITLSSINPPLTIIANSNGRLAKLNVKNKENIKANQILGVIENTADYNDVLILEKRIDSILILKNITDSTIDFSIQNDLKMGELTPFYLQALKSIKDYSLFMSINSFHRQAALLKNELDGYNVLLFKYKKQLNNNDEQLKLVEIDFQRDKKLLSENAISLREFENKKREYLNAINSNEQLKISIANVMIQINSVEKNILQLQLQDYNDLFKFKNEALQSLRTLSSEIKNWKKKYLLTSHINGQVNFFNYWSENQNLKVGDEIFTILPYEKQKFVGKSILPAFNSGKLKKGQIVNIKLDNYQYYEYGMIKGILANISEVPNKGMYFIDIELPNGLNTTYHKNLVFKELMKGKAEIITENISLFDRLFFDIHKLNNRN